MSKDKTVEKIPEIQFPHELKARNMGYQHSRYTCVKCHRNMDGDAGEGCPVLLATELREANQRVEAAGEFILTSVYNYLIRSQNGIRAQRRAAKDPIIQFEYWDIGDYYEGGLDFIHSHWQKHFEVISADGQDAEGE